jgi:hypothetical protein
MTTIKEYWETVERWTIPSNVPTVRIGRRDKQHYTVQDPTGRSPSELAEMLEELRLKMDLGPND